MYDRLYAAMVDAKVATPLDKSEYYRINRTGSRVKTGEDPACHQIKHCLSHPQYVLFVYEVGVHINHMEDSNKWGQRNISVKGTRTNLLSSKASCRFILMVPTAATGETVLCVCIFSAISLSFTYVKGFDYRASIPYDSSKTMEENMGEGKALPGFPVYKFRGKLIPVLICMSPKGKISSEILTEALKHSDQINIFKWRQYVLTPSGLFDSHGSRLQLPFLEYINFLTPDEQRKWTFTHGTLNATDVWQVGDSCNQN